MREQRKSSYKANKWKFFLKTFNKKAFSITQILLGKKTTYTMNFPYNYVTYSPWFDAHFIDIFNKIKDHTIVTEDRSYIIHRFCQYCLRLEGDFAECGVFKGGTALLMAITMQGDELFGTSKTLHLFDTFEGMPKKIEKERDGHYPGDFSNTSFQDVQHLLTNYPKVKIYPGLIPETFLNIEEEHFSFVHIDVDTYPATLDSVKFFYERMVKGGVLLCDDYGFFDYQKAAKAAIDDFFRDKAEKPITLNTGQCFIIKL